MSEYLTTPEGRRIAYDRTEGQGPGVVFLGGFKSDKEGTKALALEAWARARAGVPAVRLFRARRVLGRFSRWGDRRLV
jgi:hypothetical protein